MESKELADRNCFDCNYSPVDWASITNGIFLCNNCAIRHSQYGDNISIVKSLTNDTTWNENCFNFMKIGGNFRLKTFLNEMNIPNTIDYLQLYRSRFMGYYRRKLKNQVLGRNFIEQIPHIDVLWNEDCYVDNDDHSYLRDENINQHSNLNQWQLNSEVNHPTQSFYNQNPSLIQPQQPLQGSTLPLYTQYVFKPFQPNQTIETYQPYHPPSQLYPSKNNNKLIEEQPNINAFEEQHQVYPSVPFSDLALETPVKEEDEESKNDGKPQGSRVSSFFGRVWEKTIEKSNNIKDKIGDSNIKEKTAYAIAKTYQSVKFAGNKMVDLAFKGKPNHDNNLNIQNNIKKESNVNTYTLSGLSSFVNSNKDDTYTQKPQTKYEDLPPPLTLQEDLTLKEDVSQKPSNEFNLLTHSELPSYPSYPFSQPLLESQPPSQSNLPSYPQSQSQQPPFQSNIPLYPQFQSQLPSYPSYPFTLPSHLRYPSNNNYSSQSSSNPSPYPFYPHN